MESVDIVNLNNQNISVYKTLLWLARYSNESEKGLQMIGKTTSREARQKIEELLGKSCNDFRSKSIISKEIEELIIDMSIVYNNAFKENKSAREVSADEYIELLQMLKEKSCHTQFNEDMEPGEIADKLARDADKLRSKIESEIEKINDTNVSGAETAEAIQYFKNKTESIIQSLEISAYTAKTKLPRESQQF